MKIYHVIKHYFCAHESSMYDVVFASEDIEKAIDHALSLIKKMKEPRLHSESMQTALLSHYYVIHDSVEELFPNIAVNRDYFNKIFVVEVELGKPIVRHEQKRVWTLTVDIVKDMFVLDMRKIFENSVLSTPTDEEMDCLFNEFRKDPDKFSGEFVCGTGQLDLEPEAYIGLLPENEKETQMYRDYEM